MDLINHCEAVGFAETHLQVRVDVTRRAPRSWDGFINVAPNPNAPSIAETLRQCLSAEERHAVESHMRPLVEQGIGIERQVMAYLWAIK